MVVGLIVGPDSSYSVGEIDKQHKRRIKLVSINWMSPKYQKHQEFYFSCLGDCSEILWMLPSYEDKSWESTATETLSTTTKMSTAGSNSRAYNSHGVYLLAHCKKERIYSLIM